MTGLCLFDAKGTHLLQVETAYSMGARMRGLLGRSGLPEGHALYIKPCPSIHTFCMQFALDLIFVDRALTVVKLVWDVAPNRMVQGGRRAHAVFEVQAGGVDRSQISVGDTLDLNECIAS